MCLYTQTLVGFVHVFQSRTACQSRTYCPPRSIFCSLSSIYTINMHTHTCVFLPAIGDPLLSLFCLYSNFLGRSPISFVHDCQLGTLWQSGTLLSSIVQRPQLNAEKNSHTHTHTSSFFTDHSRTRLCLLYCSFTLTQSHRLSTWSYVRGPILTKDRRSRSRKVSLLFLCPSVLDRNTVQEHPCVFLPAIGDPLLSLFCFVHFRKISH